MALKRTEMITYNVHDRGRKARGVDRRFDLGALARMVNSPSVQERVKLGDMLGYLGHWPRIKFGLATTEAGIVDGKVIAVPLAIRTVYLSADEEGNITHQAEFLDTNEGRMAARLYDSQAGGFSSAIEAVPRSNPSLASDFHGYDFVYEPNFSGNRGHKAVLDAVSVLDDEERENAMALLDAVAGESTIALQMFDSLQAQHALALDTVALLSRENDDLITRLARAPKAGGATALLDGIVGENGRVAPQRFNPAHDFGKFRDMPLIDLAPLPTAGRQDDSAEAAILRNHFGMKD